MYNKISELITNDLVNYHNRPLTKKTISRYDLSILQHHVERQARYEYNADLARELSRQVNLDLFEHVRMVTNFIDCIQIQDDFIDILRDLVRIDEELSHQEAENLGFGHEARELRKMWRKKLNEAHKWLDRSVKYKIEWIKEHKKPRAAYVINATCELHNGLYWTIKALIEYPQFIKEGFKRVR